MDYSIIKRVKQQELEQKRAEQEALEHVYWDKVGEAARKKIRWIDRRLTRHPAGGFKEYNLTHPWKDRKWKKRLGFRFSEDVALYVQSHYNDHGIEARASAKGDVPVTVTLKLP